MRGWIAEQQNLISGVHRGNASRWKLSILFRPRPGWSAQGIPNCHLPTGLVAFPHGQLVA
jgi:hypothetical protein